MRKPEALVRAGRDHDATRLWIIGLCIMIGMFPLPQDAKSSEYLISKGSPDKTIIRDRMLFTDSKKKIKTCLSSRVDAKFL